LNNESGARISAAGGATVTLHGDLNNNGDVITTSSSKTVVLGNVSGSGDFSSSGAVEFASGFSPGNSPGQVSFGGDLTLSSTSELKMELAGGDAGSGYDQVLVNGLLTIAGSSLDIDLIGGFSPEMGDVFQLLNWDNKTGNFGDVSLESLTGGLSWDTSNLGSSGFIQAVPEPAAYSLLASLMSLGWAICGRRRRVKGIPLPCRFGRRNQPCIRAPFLTPRSRLVRRSS